jgi:hypothetical protein
MKWYTELNEQDCDPNKFGKILNVQKHYIETLCLQIKIVLFVLNG